MPISHNEKGQILIHLNQEEWETYGREAGYLMKPPQEKDQSDFLKKEIEYYSPEQILTVIKKLGEESLAGYSGVTIDEIEDALNMCEEYELYEILSLLKKPAKEILATNSEKKAKFSKQRDLLQKYPNIRKMQQEEGLVPPFKRCMDYQ